MKVDFLNPKNGGIEADDYEGKLKIDYYIARHDDALSQGYSPKPYQIGHTTKEGFRKVTEADFKNIFSLSLMRANGLTGNRKAEWNKSNITKRTFVHENENEKGKDSWITFKDDLPPLLKHNNGKNCFYLVAGHVTNLGETFAISQDSCLSKGLDNVKVLVTRIELQKAGGKNADDEPDPLQITLYFLGTGNKRQDPITGNLILNDPITLSIKPNKAMWK